ncbi:MAG: gamma-glutamyl-gamma-aminobutyrate hydrolase family protein [Bacteroidetes bacterium]|nr:gamma-glutamyl-gamma-aminobutyrate hydrolase family protein [Bacteroidota bacterium]
MRKIPYPLIFIAFIAISLFSCLEKEPETIKIAISKTNDNYSSWVERNGENAVWVDLYGLHIDSALKILDNCDGLLVTGGEDVYPDYYGKISDTAKCGTFDRYRDSLELALIGHAFNINMPVFGVCRGLQILNVALGGTLIIDIPDDFDTIVIHRQKEWQNCYHDVTLDTTSQLFMISGVHSAQVNSNHHQGIDKLGNELIITSYAMDSLPESIQWKNNKGKGFLMAVQWHPERMDKIHPLAKNLAVEFLREATEYQKYK